MEMDTSTAEIFHLGGNQERPAYFRTSSRQDANTNNGVLHFHINEERDTNSIICHVFVEPKHPTHTSNKIDSEASKPLIEAINKFREMEPNWNGYKAKVPKEQAIEDAISLVKFFSDPELPTRAGLSSDGEICLIWEEDNLFADIGVTGEGTYTYFIKKDSEKLYGDDLSLSEDLPAEARRLLSKQSA